MAKSSDVVVCKILELGTSRILMEENFCVERIQPGNKSRKERRIN